jgi:hypothetical protein
MVQTLFRTSFDLWLSKKQRWTKITGHLRVAFNDRTRRSMQACLRGSHDALFKRIESFANFSWFDTPPQKNHFVFGWMNFPCTGIILEEPTFFLLSYLLAPTPLPPQIHKASLSTFLTSFLVFLPSVQQVKHAYSSWREGEGWTQQRRQQKSVGLFQYNSSMSFPIELASMITMKINF